MFDDDLLLYRNINNNLNNNNPTIYITPNQ